MKKITALLVALILLISLAACGAGNNRGVNNAGNNTV